MRKTDILKWCLPCSAAFFSSIFQAFGIYHIHSQSAISEGGILGLTLLFQHWYRLSPALTSLLANILCYLLGWKTMGKRFLIVSAFAVLGFSVGYRFFELFPPLFPRIAEYPFLAAVFGAIFVGIGSGVAVLVGGATTGDDALAMSFSNILKIDIRWIYLISDFSVLFLSLSYIPFSRIFYSCITVVLSGQIIGWIQKSSKYR